MIRALGGRTSPPSGCVAGYTPLRGMMSERRSSLKDGWQVLVWYKEFRFQNFKGIGQMTLPLTRESLRLRAC